MSIETIDRELLIRDTLTTALVFLEGCAIAYSHLLPLMIRRFGAKAGLKDSKLGPPPLIPRKELTARLDALQGDFEGWIDRTSHHIQLAVAQGWTPSSEQFPDVAVSSERRRFEKICELMLGTNLGKDFDDEWFKIMDIRVALEAERDQLARPGGDRQPTYQPAAWFVLNTGILLPTLRQAVRPGRRHKRVRRIMVDGRPWYCVEDARRWWPTEFYRSPSSVKVRNRP